MDPYYWCLDACFWNLARHLVAEDVIQPVFGCLEVNVFEIEMEIDVVLL